MSKTRSFLCLSAAIAVCTTAFAAEPGFQVSTSPGQQTRGVQLGAPELRLSLKDATALALEHNINLEVSRVSASRGPSRASEPRQASSITCSNPTPGSATPSRRPPTTSWAPPWPFKRAGGLISISPRRSRPAAALRSAGQTPAPRPTPPSTSSTRRTTRAWFFPFRSPCYGVSAPT